MKDSQFTIWLYGSLARGDPDAHSDRDVLVVGYPSAAELSGRLESLGPDLSISEYDWSEIEKMAGYGSLFLHHLRLEGICLFEAPEARGRLAGLLGRLGPYTRARRDWAAFETAIEDIRSTPHDLTTPIFEMAVIATLLRHSSVLGCYVSGSPKFGRVEPFQFLVKRWSMPQTVSHHFATIYRFRLHEEGRCGTPYSPTRAHVDSWASFAEVFLGRLREEIDDYERRVLAAH